MTAYYNENDPRAAEWLRWLILLGCIAPGEVDERGIEDVTPNDIRGFTQCHFFAGIGGWSYALRLAGWPDDRPVWTGSCPCQPFSAAGKGAGFADKRHLWPIFHWLIQQCAPPIAFGEQVKNGGGLSWLDLVFTDLENSGYSCAAANLCAASEGHPHTRERLFWVAENADTNGERWKGVREAPNREARSQKPEFARLVPPKLSLTPPSGPYGLRDDGVSGGVGLLRGFGNAIVPQVAATFVGAYLDAMG